VNNLGLYRGLALSVLFITVAVASFFVAGGGTALASYSAEQTHLAPLASASPTPGPCPPSWRIAAVPDIRINELNAVEVISENDIWAVGKYPDGSQTLTVHWNGSTWSIVPSPGNPTPGHSDVLRGVSAVAPNDVWAVGNYDPASGGRQTLILHWNGVQWSVVPSPNFGSNNQLYSVAAISANDVWAVGYVISGDTSALILHWDGTSWTRFANPNVRGLLAGVEAVSANDVWAVGTEYIGTSDSETLTMHWNGSQWSVVPSPNVAGGTYLSSISAIAPNDIWAVGTTNLILHWDGSQWSLVPGLGGTSQPLFGVSAVSANDVWAVGTRFMNGESTLIVHWDGTGWTQVSSPSPEGSEVRLVGIDAIGPRSMWAVGWHSLPTTGENRMLILRYTDSAPCPTATPTLTSTVTATRTATPTITPTSTPACGLAWRIVPSPNGGSFNTLEAVDVLSANNAWAVGSYFNGSDRLILAEHWNGSTWSVVPVPQPAEGSGFLYDVEAISENDVWAVGNANGSTLILHWNGTAWSRVSSPSAQGWNVLNGVWAAASNDVWAVGYSSINLETDQKTLIQHWNGSSWTIVPSPNRTNYGNTLYAISGTSAADIWAVGDSVNDFDSAPLALHWNGTAWTIVNTPNGDLYDRLYSVAAIAPNDVWAGGSLPQSGGSGRAMLHWDGTQWSTVTTPPLWNATHYDIAAISSNDIWASGRWFDTSSSMYITLIEHWDGSAWSVVPSPNPGEEGATLLGISAVSSSDLWAVGTTIDANTSDDTLIERYSDPCITPTPGPSSTRTTTPTITTTPVASNTSVATGTAISATGTAVQASSTPGIATSTSAVTTATATGTSVFATNTPRTATTTAVASSPTLTPCAIAFADVPTSNTFYSHIRCLVCRNIMGGYADNTFRPNNDITRGQLSKIVANSAGFNEPVSSQTFEDVPSTNTFYPFVERMAGRGIIGGYPCGGVSEPCGSGKPYFRPNANATRGQISKIVSESARFNDSQAGQTFEDVAIGSTFHLWIERLASRGIMGGYACGGAGEPCGPGNKPYFRPNARATRGQTSKIVANTFYPNCQTPPGR
jgi:hypothetical protein